MGCIIIQVLLPAYIRADDESIKIESPPPVVIFGGEQYLAVRVAISDFEKKLDADNAIQRENARRLHTDVFQFAITDYLIEIKDDNVSNAYTISFRLKTIDGVPFFGGGANYLIDKATLEIKDKEYSM